MSGLFRKIYIWCTLKFWGAIFSDILVCHVRAYMGIHSENKWNNFLSINSQIHCGKSYLQSVGWSMNKGYCSSLILDRSLWWSTVFSNIWSCWRKILLLQFFLKGLVVNYKPKSLLNALFWSLPLIAFYQAKAFFNEDIQNVALFLVYER